MRKAIIKHHTGLTLQFTDDDVVDPDAWVPQGEYNPHNVRPWLIVGDGLTLALVFASNVQDALDEAVDANKLEDYLVPENEHDPNSDEWERYALLGNASEPFDLEAVHCIELPNPKFSFVAQFNEGERGDA